MSMPVAVAVVAAADVCTYHISSQQQPQPQQQ